MLNPYYDDWLKVKLNTSVEDVIEENDLYWTYFKENIFYHESGGQASDKAMVNNHQVLNSKYIDSKLYLLLDTKLEGDALIDVDLEDRIIRSQIHTTQHVMCSYINKHYNAKTVAFFNDDKEAGAEMAFNEINENIIKDIEYVVNKAIIEDLKVEIIYPDKDDMLGLVKDEKLDHEELRAVRIGDIDFDMCACIHVPSLRYLQMFKIERYEKTTRGYKLFFLVGEQFKNTYKKQYDVLKKASTQLASPVFEINEAIDKLNNDLKESKAKYESLNNQYLESLANKYVESDDELVIDYYNDLDTKSLSKLVSIINNNAKKKIFMIAINDNRMHLIVSHHKDIEMDSRNIFKELSSKYELKGGGNPFMAQGGGNLNLDIIEDIKKMMNN